jgi:hypothetical protein
MGSPFGSTDPLASKFTVTGTFPLATLLVSAACGGEFKVNGPVIERSSK